MSRRSLIFVVGIAAGVLIAGVIASRLAANAPRPGQSPGEPVRPASAAVRAYFGDLTEGRRLDRWTLVHVFDVREGAIPVVLATESGQRFQVDLLRRDPAGPRGVAETTQLSLYVANGGDGGTATPEELAKGALALAAALTERENAGAKPPALASLTERMAFPAHHSSVPLDR